MNTRCEQALQRLLLGNGRYTAMRQLHPRQTTAQRQILIDGQYPFAAILSCSDSRVPSELVFDQGLGDLFIVRTAGHTVDDLVLASIEYAVHALEVPLVMVLGHASCGAVTAVMQGQTLPGHMHQLEQHLRPALHDIDTHQPDSVELAIRANARYTAAQIVGKSEILTAAVQQDRIGVVAAYYHLRTGEVEVLN